MRRDCIRKNYLIFITKRLLGYLSVKLKLKKEIGKIHKKDS